MTAASDGGWFVLPKKIGMLVVIGGLFYLGQTIYSEIVFKTNIQSEVASLRLHDVESRARGDDVRRRLTELEKQRSDLSDRLTRVEEQQKVTIDLLREIRDDMRKRPHPSP